MPEFHFSVSLHVLLVSLALVLSALGSLAVYRVTVPPIPRKLKTILVTLRASGLFLLFLLIGEPLLSLVNRSQEPPGIAILLDNSKSMTIKDKAGDRKNALRQTLRSSGIEALESIGAPCYIVFDSRPRILQSFAADSLTFQGDATDLAAAFKAVQRLGLTRNIQGVVLLSDGNHTVGSSPLFEAEELGLPVFAVGLGDTSEQRDLLIRKVLTNSITYVGNRVPVHVTLKSSGYDGRRVEVTVRNAEKILDRRFQDLQSGTREYLTTLYVSPAQEGMQKFTVEVSRLQDELTERNNSSSFFMKVLKSKMKVLLIAGAPGPDVSFIRRGLESDKNIEVIPRIERLEGQFYEGILTSTLTQEADCIALVGYPGPASSPESLRLIEAAANQGKGVLFVPARTLDAIKLRSLQGILPFLVQSLSQEEYQAFFHIPEAQRSNVIVKLAGPGGSDGKWENLPPLFRLQGMIKAKPESETIAQARIQSVVTNEPFLLSRNVNRKKSLALLGYGLWRWKMAAETNEKLFEEFLGNAVRWLTTREDDRRVRVTPAQEIFNAQDPLEFTAQVYDESFRGIDNAQVNISVSGRNERYAFILSSLGSGQYEGSVEALPEGDYTFHATVAADGKPIGEDRGRFSIGGLNVEFQDTRLNKQLLGQLALRSGGAYYDPDKLQNLPRDIRSLPSFQPRDIVRATEIELWNLPWSLIVLVALFAVEWYVRKRNGML